MPAVTSSTASTITLSNTCARNPCCAVIFCENTFTSCTGNYDTSFTNGASSVQTTLAAWVVAVIVVGVVIVIAAAVREVCRRRAIKAAQNAITTIVVGNPVANPSAVMAPPEYAASSAMPPPLPPTAMYPPPAMPPAPPYPPPPYGGAPGIYGAPAGGYPPPPNAPGSYPPYVLVRRPAVSRSSPPLTPTDTPLPVFLTGTRRPPRRRRSSSSTFERGTRCGE